MTEWPALHFEQAWWLWIWPVSTLILGWLVYRDYLHTPGSILWSANQGRVRHPQLGILRRLKASSGPGSKDLLGAWLVYSLFALGIHAALARPFYHGEQLPPPPSQRDAMFIIDSSISMVLKDYLVDGQRVDRMSMLKSVMQHLIDRLEGNRLGIIAFSEQAQVLVPLTDDYAVLRYQVRRLRPASLTGRTSRPGQALLYALGRLDQDKKKSGAHPDLVLISDINRPDRQIDPRIAAEYLASQGYHLHVIGIGGASYAAGDKESHGLIYHPSNFALLKAVAEHGKGHFYWAKDTASLQAAIRTIQQAEKQSSEVEPRFVPQALFQWPLGFSLLLLTLLSLPWRWRGGA